MKCPHCGKRVDAAKGAPTIKQRAFAAHYVTNGGNATEAARAAGYKGDDNALAVQGARNLRHPKVAPLVEAAAIPVEELVWQTIREVARDTSEPHARTRSVELAAKIRGMMAPVKHQHAHVHIDAADMDPELLVRQVAGSWPMERRREVLSPLLSEPSHVPVLPARCVPVVEKSDCTPTEGTPGDEDAAQGT